jgi:hypothetical protein
MAGGERANWETKQGRIRHCVPHCDRAVSEVITDGPLTIVQGVPVDCNHIRLRKRRHGFWREGKWIDHAPYRDLGDRRVGPEWATHPEGEDADMRRRYQNGATQEEIAKLYGLDQSTVSRRLNGNHQRPLGKYGNGEPVKRPPAAELAAINREVQELRNGTWRPNEAEGQTWPYLELSHWPMRLYKDDKGNVHARPVFAGSDAWTKTWD